MNKVGPYLAFNKDWFDRNQTVLFWLLNNRFTKKWFRKVMRIDCIGVINRIEPNAYWFDGVDNGDQIEIKADFRTHAKYGKRLYYAFKPIWWAIHFWDWLIADRFLPQWSYGFDTLTQYPSSGNPGAITCDAVVYKSYGAGSGVSWATLLAATGDSINDTSPAAYFSIISDTVSNQWRQCRRFLMGFDTSSIDDAATISSAVCSLFGTASSDGLSVTPNINIYGATPASNTNYVGTDYNNVGSTEYATAIAFGSWSAVGYNDFTFNATGIAAISKTGITRLCARNANYDVAAVAPTWSSSTASSLSGETADASGTSNDPQLVVIYSLLSGPANIKTYKGLAAASVKTLKGLAIASVKTKKGLN